MPLKHWMKMGTESRREEGGDTGETAEGLPKQLTQMPPNSCCQMHWPQENGDVLSQSTWAEVMPTHTHWGTAGQQSPPKTVYSPQDKWDKGGVLWKGHCITHPIREIRVATKHLGIRDSPLGKTD